ncbi:MAG: FHA domain-containing protein [Anaerolineales bacterium]|nr:MAG: FHA domain-containing protein [Anaerolineales bacterium]
MQTGSLPKFCPVCKLANDNRAVICEFCGASFVDLHLGRETTRNITNRRTTDLIHQDYELKTAYHGMAFFLHGKTEPFALHDDDVIYVGRLEEAAKDTIEVFVDLAPVDGFAQGVSRRHAMIQRVENRYEIIDLHSSNGTFLNGTRLLPSKPYELKSGAVVQLGRLKLILIFTW